MLSSNVPSISNTTPAISAISDVIQSNIVLGAKMPLMRGARNLMLALGLSASLLIPAMAQPGQKPGRKGTTLEQATALIQAGQLDQARALLDPLAAASNAP